MPLVHVKEGQWKFYLLTQSLLLFSSMPRSHSYSVASDKRFFFDENWIKVYHLLLQLIALNEERMYILHIGREIQKVLDYCVTSISFDLMWFSSLLLIFQAIPLLLKFFYQFTLTSTLLTYSIYPFHFVTW